MYMQKINKKISGKIYITAICMCIAYFLNKYGLQLESNKDENSNSLKNFDNIYTVVKVVDGDTMVVENEEQSIRVRLIRSGYS